MKSKQYLQRNLTQTLDKKAPKEILLSGNMGVIIDGDTRLSVAGRPGYVYVRLRGNLSELIQAYNSVVSPIYDLPVLVSSSPSTNQYTIIGRDIQKYSNWGESPYLPRHGNQHSFQPETGGGGDVVWVASRQFLPLLIHPSGTYGSAGVYIEPSIYYWEEAWHYAGGTGTPSLLTYKPTDDTAKMLMIYLDSTGNPQYEVGGSFDSSYTGTSQIVNYIPTSISLSDGIPLGAVRLVSGTSVIGWDNIYDLRPYLSPERFVTGSYALGNHTHDDRYYTEGEINILLNGKSDTTHTHTHFTDTTNPHSVTKDQVGLGNVTNLKYNLAATSAPTVSDDSGDGYAVGSSWFDTTNDKAYLCLDATIGVAIWQEVGAGSGLVSEGPGIDLVGTQIGLGGDSILVYRTDGNPASEFAATNLGLSAALAAALGGDVVMLPAGEISGDQTVPAGVSLVGMGRDASILSGKITLSDGANLSNLKLAISGNDDVNAVVSVLAPVTGEAHLHDCSVAPINAGLGGVHAIEVNSGGDLYCHDCFLDGRGVIEGATGYAGYRLLAGSGSLYIDGGVCLGSDPDNPFND